MRERVELKSPVPRIGHAGICEGGARQLASLPRQMLKLKGAGVAGWRLEAGAAALGDGGSRRKSPPATRAWMWGWKSRYSPKVFSFSIARKLLERFEGTPLELDMRSVLAKIADSLRGTVSLDVESLTDQLAGFSAPAFFKDAFGISQAEKPWEVRLLFAREVATYIRERLWHARQELRQRRDGALELRLLRMTHTGQPRSRTPVARCSCSVAVEVSCRGRSST